MWCTAYHGVPSWIKSKGSNMAYWPIKEIMQVGSTASCMCAVCSLAQNLMRRREINQLETSAKMSSSTELTGIHNSTDKLGFEKRSSMFYCMHSTHGLLSAQCDPWKDVKTKCMVYCTMLHTVPHQIWSTVSCAEHSNQAETCINRDPDDLALCDYKCPAHPININEVWSIASYCRQCTHQWSLTMESHQVWMEVEVNFLPACGKTNFFY